MTSDAVERYYGQNAPGEDNIIASMVRWIVRIVGASWTMLIWGAIVLMFAALFTPGKQSRGLELHLGLNQLFGSITIVYYLAILPLLLIPTRDDEQFTWFVVTALGWIGCLLGSVLFLRSTNQLLIQNVVQPTPMAQLATIGGIFIVGLIVCLIQGDDSHRRLWSATALAVVGGGFCIALTFERGKYVSQALLNRLGFEPEPMLQTLILVATAATFVFLVWTFVLPQRRDNPTQTFGLLLLMLGFCLAGCLCYGMINGMVLLRPVSGSNEFRCLVATAIAAPFISWLGMPWTRGSRFGWIVGLALAGVSTSLVLDWSKTIAGHTVVDQMWTQYDGPHLVPHLQEE